MKRIIGLFLLALTLLLCSCNKETRTQSVRVVINNETNKKNIVDVSELDVIGFADEEKVNFLDEIEGFWVRVGDGEENDDAVPFTEMLVVSADESWTPYYNGVAGQPLYCSADVNGLCLYDVEGNVNLLLGYNGTTLSDSDGDLIFEREMTVEERLALEAAG